MLPSPGPAKALHAPSAAAYFLGGAASLRVWPRDGLSRPRVWQGSEAVDVDRWELVGRGLNDVAVVMGLHEFAPVGGRAAGGASHAGAAAAGTKTPSVARMRLVTER